MTEEKRESIWVSLKNRFPWKDMFFGFLVPKVFFLYGARHGVPFLWGTIAIAWCVGVFYLNQVRNHKVNFFAIFAVIMILARVVVVLVENNPKMYLYVLALDNFVVGFIFMASLLLKRSMMQLFADSVSTQAPPEVMRSVYYQKAWQIVTFVWGAVFMLFGVALLFLKYCNLKIVGLIDMLANWPLVIVLFIFTVKFPAWYWKKRIPGV